EVDRADSSEALVDIREPGLPPHERVRHLERNREDVRIGLDRAEAPVGARSDPGPGDAPAVELDALEGLAALEADSLTAQRPLPRIEPAIRGRAHHRAVDLVLRRIHEQEARGLPDRAAP